MHSKRYFIAFEGIDGCGKSTAARGVSEKLQALGYPCVVTREHQHDRETGRRIADILEDKRPMVEPFELQKLFVIDRLDHVKNVIEPTLAKGKIVLTDRYWFSTLAYGMLSGALERYIQLHYEIMGEHFLKPDRTYYLDISPELAMERIKKSRSTTNYFEKIEKLGRIRNNYLELIKKDFGSVRVIDATEAPIAIIKSILADLLPQLSGIT